MPTVTVASEAFATLGRSVAEHHGMPDLPFVVVPHPVALESEASIRGLAERSIEAVVAALTSGARS